MAEAGPKPGLIARQIKKIADQVDAALGPALENDETVQVRAHGLVMPSMWWGLLINAGLLYARAKPYAIAVTDRRVVVVRLRRSMAKINGGDLESSEPLGSIKVTKFKPAMTWTKMELERKDGNVLKIRFDRAWKDDAIALNSALGGPTG